jgi:hypothetical protein
MMLKMIPTAEVVKTKSRRSITRHGDEQLLGVTKDMCKEKASMAL